MLFIDLYRISLAGLLGGHCRYIPSCSNYSRQAFLTYGFTKGLFLSLKRIARCHPWGGFGHDPVDTILQSRGAHHQWNKNQQ